MRNLFKISQKPSNFQFLVEWFVQKPTKKTFLRFFKHLTSSNFPTKSAATVTIEIAVTIKVKLSKIPQFRMQTLETDCGLTQKQVTKSLCHFVIIFQLKKKHLNSSPEKWQSFVIYKSFFCVFCSLICARDRKLVFTKNGLDCPWRVVYF